ncbi:FAD:protein FMN transferase [Ancrocorticia populi]|nr:FAD:protein FMN transferase [Ancrocorticia populi]
MGTLLRVAWAGNNHGIAAALHQKVRHLERLMTRFREDSEVSRLGSQWVEVSSDTAAVLGAAKLYEHQTGGHFSVLVGRQMREWEAIAGGDAAKPRPTRGKIEIDGPRCRILDAPERPVDLGGIAKGYAADQLRDLARSMGATDVLVSLGTSSISVAGAPATIGLASPWHGPDRIGSLTLELGALAVSADPGTRIGAQRRRSHVLNPDTGTPALTDLCGVVVTGADGMACEAFSTAYLAMGLSAAMHLDAQHPELNTVFMTVDGRLLASPDLKLRTVSGLQAWFERQR